MGASTFSRLSHQNTREHNYIWNVALQSCTLRTISTAFACIASFPHSSPLKIAGFGGKTTASEADLYMAVPTRLPRERILSIGEEAAKAFLYTKDFDIGRVVEELGGRIILNDFWDNETKTGSLEVSGLRDFDIFIPSHTTDERDRFTIAHELGHYILHYLPNADPRHDSKFRIGRYGDSAIEREANLFASAFLMPEQQFKDSYSNLGGDLSAVAKDFRVSEVAAQVRAKMLGLYDGRKPKPIGSAANVSAA